MNCKDAREMTAAYLDNNLDPMNDILITGHMESCPGCRDEIMFLIRYRNAIKTFKPIPAPENLLSEIHRRIELEREQSLKNRTMGVLRRLFDTYRFPVEAAGVLAAVVVIFFLYKPFFTEKGVQTFTEYGVKAPAGEVSAEKDTAPGIHKEEKLMEPARLQKQKSRAVNDNIIPDKGDSLSSRETELPVKDDKESVSVSVDQKKTAPSVESEKTAGDEVMKSYSPGISEEQKSVRVKKGPSQVSVSNAEKIFWESEVSIIRKDLSNGERLFYKIKISPLKYDKMINRLNRDFSVEEKFIKKSKSDYQIELFLEKK